MKNLKSEEIVPDESIAKLFNVKLDELNKADTDADYKRQFFCVDVPELGANDFMMAEGIPRMEDNNGSHLIRSIQYSCNVDGHYVMVTYNPPEIVDAINAEEEDEDEE